MTAPEPITLVELVQYLGERDYWLGYDSSGMYIAMPVDKDSPAACGTGSTPWEAANEAMPGRRVAPRDEAAELRAAAEEALEAIKHQQRDPAYHSAFLLLQRAARRLRAALAASEGQP